MYNPDKHHRRSIRLRRYEYRWPGLYFVTVCTHLRRCLLSEVVDGSVVLSATGRIVQDCLFDLPSRFPGLKIDSHVIMPNHVHVILAFTTIHPGTSPPHLGSVIRHWKASSCRLIRTGPEPSFGWQRNYFERILRNEPETEQIRGYIATNPLRWDQDKENPHILDAPPAL